MSGQAGGASRQQRKAERAVVSQEDTFDEITDKHIPQRPLGVVEGTSYSLVILAAIGFGIAILWTAVSSLLIQPKEYTCFNVTLDKLRDDPRVTVRLGTPISGYGQESRNRAARQRIPHRAYKDDNGTEHIQVRMSAHKSSMCYDGLSLLFLTVLSHSHVHFCRCNSMRKDLQEQH